MPSHYIPSIGLPDKLSPIPELSRKLIPIMAESRVFQRVSGSFEDTFEEVGSRGVERVGLGSSFPSPRILVEKRAGELRLPAPPALL
jgi:hypothetical protein